MNEIKIINYWWADRYARSKKKLLMLNKFFVNLCEILEKAHWSNEM